MRHEECIAILDFGSQYTQLIARKVRECGVYAELYPYTLSEERLVFLQPKGIILSGGPSSVYAADAPMPVFDIVSFAETYGVPILGLCYGLQLIAHTQGGSVHQASKREFGYAALEIVASSPLWKGVQSGSQVWMSHGDALTALPSGFEVIAKTDNAPYCAIQDLKRRIFGVQFHPEVHHTIDGKTMLANFLFEVCGCTGTWNEGTFVEAALQEVRAQVGNAGVLCALSGGVDSTVAAVFLHKAIGKQLHCIHIDNGLMRSNESQTVAELFGTTFNIPIQLVDASELFLRRLEGVEDPEHKRKVIGTTFIEVFESEAKKFRDVEFLAQGTLYPDVIESVSQKGPSATIKTHHNVGGLPETMKLRLVEPFRELFKDEVRAVGRMLGVPAWFIDRHPFPGPGLAIRIPGAVTRAKLKILRQADDIYLEEIRRAGLYHEIWQAFAVLLPVRTVGVMGDERTYEYVCALRAVTSVDGMTADWFPMPHDILARISNRIVSEVRGINRVVYDISSKPPATIEWE
ncbi:MAG: glutamine-hydrolyzing GMP synthase [Bacteroidota bacterium]|nr:glutamine-hydrolyzing GMP synthase [Candidatus Kapabacteria bacterium]MDW8219668.1 glutamine-hydrolyzing GMP synthase [Bacteroidota bacterium]